MAKTESTAITNLVHMLASRPAPSHVIARDSEPTMLVDRPRRSAPIPWGGIVVQQTTAQDDWSPALVMAIAAFIGITVGIVVGLVS